MGIEVFGQGLAKVGMCWSQPTRVDHMHKMWRAGRIFFHFWNLFNYYYYFFGSLGNGLGLLGEWVYNTPIF
jgi:hypothetical protein